MATKEQRRRPQSRRYAQAVSKPGRLMSSTGKSYNVKTAIWHGLLRTDKCGTPELVCVPRENRSAYREAMALVRAGYARIEHSGECTLYIRRAKDCNVNDIRHALNMSRVEETASPARVNYNIVQKKGQFKG